LLNPTVSIYHTFRNLQSNCISFPIVCDGNSREAWTKAVDKLQFDILPSLRQQISHLPKLLNPSEILQDDINGSLLKTIIEIQSGLGENNSQILSISSQLQNNLIESAPRTDDKDFKGLKQFRLEGVSHELESLGVQLTYIFDLGAETLIEFTKSDSTKAARYWHPIRILNHTNEIMDYTTEATAIIDNVLEWLPRSEFIDIQEGWNVGLFDHGREIIKLTQFINRTISYPELKDNGELSDDASSHSRADSSLITLAQLLIPIIKLSRLFFTKLAKDGFNKITVKTFTDMNSYQLGKLSDSAYDISGHLSEIVKLLEEYDEDSIGDTMTQAINKIRSSFETNLLLVMLYIAPLVPDSISPPNYLQNSLIAWNDLFLMATQNLLRFYNES
jgi:hypothetical protein